ncbi:metallophosphatase family protein [Chloroflexi bacterium TSY]|nr:metallophosphatase family protein [Chloroflexi bacterium TSY]
MHNTLIPPEFMPDRFLSSIGEQGDALARIGLISDTHMPERWPQLPQAVFDVLNGVDLILHAGDVGELWVLDQLSQIAPVVAVHGNDETEEAQEELPLQQVLSIAGQRILLWHNHFPDRVDEFWSRTDPLEPKMQRLANRSKRAGAKIVVFGHWHIPLVYEQEGITMVNPGAIASGNEVMRQTRQTVALLFLTQNATCEIVHVDLAQPERPFAPQIDLAAGFQRAAEQFSEMLISPELEAYLPMLRKLFYEELPRSVRGPIRAAIMRAAEPCWAGEKDLLTPDDWWREIEQAIGIPPEVKERLKREFARVGLT